MITITKAEVLTLLERAVNDKGAHYVDPQADFDNCSYVVEGKPGCIVGHVLFYAGAPIETLERWDRDVSALQGVVGRLEPDQDSVELGGVELERDALIALHEAQKVQDANGTWSNALAAAERYLEVNA